jgi:YidC/Oxa1 family membrane protein insertase
MDRNSAIGLTLIAALLLGYFYFFSPQPQPAQKPVAGTEASGSVKGDTTVKITQPSDSVLAATYGDLSVAMKGTENTTTIETQDLKVTFSNRGGVIQQLELKKYKTYSQKPLLLITPDNHEFSLKAAYQGKDIDLYSLYYQPEQTKSGDTTLLTYTLALSNGAIFKQVYKIPAQGYEIGYALQGKGLDQQINGDNLNFHWAQNVMLIEKDMTETRKNTTVTYYLNNDGFDELSATANGTESEVLTTPVKWVTVKQKFFLSSIIARTSFPSGEVRTVTSDNNLNSVKVADISLVIPKKALSENNTQFKFYMGPNDYKKIGDVSEDFRKNVYLGWRPIYWINKFVIFPVFHFLTQFIGNYGLIIIILVILLKLVLLPLSYRSYLSMAKMKVLKPEIDEIKERVGDDMTKQQQEQMKLYSQVGVNPISGCIPVLLQMPLIFAMFYLFPASIELRQQPFLWAEDLSTYDSLISFSFTIPFLGNHISLFTVLMTISTLVYTWQNNQISSVQGPMKSMSYIMPVIFFFVLNSFSAGLTFYYLVSNLVTFAQQAVIKRFVDENKIRAIMEENRKKNAQGGGGGKKSKFMARLEEAMKASEEARQKAEADRKKRKDGKK